MRPSRVLCVVIPFSLSCAAPLAVGGGAQMALELSQGPPPARRPCKPTSFPSYSSASPNCWSCASADTLQSFTIRIRKVSDGVVGSHIASASGTFIMQALTYLSLSHSACALLDHITAPLLEQIVLSNRKFPDIILPEVNLPLRGYAVDGIEVPFYTLGWAFLLDDLGGDREYDEHSIQSRLEELEKKGYRPVLILWQERLFSY